MMTFTSCLQKQQEVQKNFSNLSSEDLYEKIILLGRGIPPLKKEFMTEKNLVKGCQSQLYLHTTYHHETMHFEAYSEALISMGLAALLLSVYNHEPPEALIKCPPHFLKQIGIHKSLSPNRSNGLISLYTRMQQDALKILMTLQKNT